MKFKPIHRNLQHVPKIWGVTYLKLFAALFSVLLVTLVYFTAVARGVMALLAGLGAGLAVYGGSLWLDSRDPLAHNRQSAFIRDALTAYSVSNQTVRIDDGDV